MNNIHKTFRAGLVFAAGLIAMGSCTDTWDDHYGDGGSMGGNSYAGTLMQAMEEQAPDFAKVVKAYGYDRELSSGSYYTVWAPVDGSFDLSEYVDENGNKVADSTTVVKEFLKSHISRYAYSLGKEEQTLNLLNDKRITLSPEGEGSFGKSEIVHRNITTKNGVLYTLAAPNPYANNLFEIIAKQYKADPTEGKDTLSLYAYLYDSKYNKDSLIEDKSVSRGVDENGNKIWVDSFLQRNNTVLKNVDARIYEEDSSFIAILPSAKAWAERYKIAESLLKFNPSEDKTAPGTCDSLQRHYSRTFAMSDLFYNMNANEYWQDSLKSTNYLSYYWYNHKYYSKMPKDMPEDKEVNDILSKCGDPVECSNGTAYLVDEYPMSVPEQFFYQIKSSGVSSINMDLDSKGAVEFTKSCVTPFYQYRGSMSQTYDGEYVGVQNYSYVYFQPINGNANPTVAIDIPNTLSGEYDIYIVTCPGWLRSYTSSAEGLDLRPYRFYVNVFERNKDGVYKNSTRMKNPVDGSNYFVTSSQKYINPDDPKSLLLINDTTYVGKYEFNNAYYGRNNAGVMVQIQSQVSSRQLSDYTRDILFSSVILKPRGYRAGTGKDDKIIVFPNVHEPIDDKTEEVINTKNSK